MFRLVARRPALASVLDDMSRQADYVLRTVQERGIRFIRLWFTDVQGFLSKKKLCKSRFPD